MENKHATFIAKLKEAREIAARDGVGNIFAVLDAMRIVFEDPDSVMPDKIDWLQHK